MSDQTPDPRPGAYYVTAIDGGRYLTAAGPWPTHAEALAAVNAVSDLAYKLEPRSHFWAWGTSRHNVTPHPIGSLNRELVNRLGWSLPVH